MAKRDSEPLDLSSIYWPLRLAYGLVPLLAGLDKFVGVLADWEKYLSPPLAGMLPVTPHAAAGLLVLAGVARLGGWIVGAWLVAIAVNLFAAGAFDVAVRDLVMAVGAYTLARVAALRGESLVPSAHVELAAYGGETA